MDAAQKGHRAKAEDIWVVSGVWLIVLHCVPLGVLTDTQWLYNMPTWEETEIGIQGVGTTFQ